ncbi:hypothetical protein SAMN04488061_2860 [Filomicrobium insigne]|uniref:Uncharacterized protein n=1 Tax=Filomicrobium insigne TaxID=418854 RepID=A0A1H0SEH6_9HYPH|nr:hypothetical protein [Filomicrobium insigne]SDP40075.1 hypothetical protein SAMN04488061_2860 [Filomicrobium insigne]
MEPIEFGSPSYQIITEINASVALLRVNEVTPINGRFECLLDEQTAVEFVATISAAMKASPEEELELHRLLRGSGFADLEGLLVKERSGSLSNIVTGMTHYVELRTSVKSRAANSES